MRFLASLLCLTVFCGWVSANQNDSDDATYYWWQSTVIYQIYPRSFFDSDGDGIGDLEGIRQKAEYLEYLGVGCIWISPIFESPMKDFGYDISNYTKIEPIFGSMEDFDKMMAEYKNRGIKVILDFVPNHSSDEHEWFNKSRNREDPYTDYYVWQDDDQSTVPNNWLSVFFNSSWEWCPIRGQFYYHAFLKEQPDLNWRSPEVKQSLKDVLRFWLERGVDGFRIDAVKFLFEDPELTDEPLSNDPDAQPDAYDYLQHIYTTSLPELYPTIAEWREVFTEFENKDGAYRLMMLESGVSPNASIPYYGNVTHPIADFPFNFEFLKLNANTTARDVHDWTTSWLESVPPGKWPNWQIGNHDQSRVASKTSQELVDALNMINLLLKGTPVTYYGEEIGMTDLFTSYEDTQDPFGIYAGPDRYALHSRDPERTPMQWNNTAQAGFTTAEKPWLPVNPNHADVNVQNQMSTNDSHLQTYRRLVALRQLQAIQHANVEFPIITDTVYSFTRVIRNDPVGVVVIVNFGDRKEVVDLANSSVLTDFKFPAKGIVKAASVGRNDVEQEVDLNRISLLPKKGIVIEFTPAWL